MLHTIQSDQKTMASDSPLLSEEGKQTPTSAPLTETARTGWSAGGTL